MSATGAGLAKLATGTVAGSGAVVYAAAAALGEAPAPEGHTVVEVLFLAMSVYLITLVRQLNKKDDTPKETVKDKDSPSGDGYSLKDKLGEIDKGVKEISGHVTNLRVDFAEFKTKIDGIDTRVENLEDSKYGRSIASQVAQ